MVIPGESGTVFPDAYLTKVPHKIQRREDRLAGAYSPEGTSKLLDLPAKLIIHEDEVLYFDYGAVRLGRKPELEDPDVPQPVCVGFGWLPGWKFTMSERGLPDIVPAQPSPPVSTKKKVDVEETGHASPGVLGLVYKLQLAGQPSTGSRSLFQKKTTVDVKDLPYAKSMDWDTAIHFHDKHKLLKQTNVYLHLFDGALGHKYQTDGNMLPFRTPDWPVRVVTHIDPSRGPLVSTKKTPALPVERRLQGNWVARELEKWVKDAGLPQAYAEQVLQQWILADSGNQLPAESSGGFKKFLGFS